MLFLSISFFFNDTATTEIYPLSLHDALPILTDAAPKLYRIATGDVLAVEQDAAARRLDETIDHAQDRRLAAARRTDEQDRKSTRLNSSHSQISYAVFCLKKQKITDSRSASTY